MDQIIEAINDGRLIDAIKRFRAQYGGVCTIGLKEAKDAVMGIKAALERADELGRQIGGENAGFNPDEEFAEHIIVHSYPEYEHEYSVMRCANKCIAMRSQGGGDCGLHAHSEVIVARDRRQERDRHHPHTEGSVRCAITSLAKRSPTSPVPASSRSRARCLSLPCSWWISDYLWR